MTSSAASAPLPGFSLHRIGPSPFIAGFELFDAELPNGIRLRFAKGGPADPAAAAHPPLLMVHGHPHNHLVWRKSAPEFARDRVVILPDLRGYGDSAKPASGGDHRPYGKRAMAEDLALLMQGLGLAPFDFAGHDRGGRAGHRLALDWPALVRRACFVDIAPTAVMYERTNMEFARRYFWWFFLIQPEPFPEKLIGFDPEYFVHCHIDRQVKIPNAVEPEVFADYVRCYSNPAMIHAVCEDYRAAASIDLEDDAADREKLIEAPLLLLWGGRGTVGQLYDVVDTWRDRARSVQGEPIDCGHSPEEEAPDAFNGKLRTFLDAPDDALGR